MHLITFQPYPSKITICVNGSYKSCALLHDAVKRHRRDVDLVYFSSGDSAQDNFVNTMAYDYSVNLIEINLHHFVDASKYDFLMGVKNPVATSTTFDDAVTKLISLDAQGISHKFKLGYAFKNIIRPFVLLPDAVIWKYVDQYKIKSLDSFQDLGTVIRREEISRQIFNNSFSV